MIYLHADEIADVGEAVDVGDILGSLARRILHVHVEPDCQREGVEKGHRTVRADRSGAKKITPHRLQVATPNVLRFCPEELSINLANELVHCVAGEMWRIGPDVVAS